MPRKRVFPVLDVGEQAEERGIKHGRMFAQEIRDNVESYLRRFEASGFNRDVALKEGDAWDVAVLRQAPEYAAEMHGVAEGANLPCGVVALLNARYEIAFMLYGRDARAVDASPATEPEGCTTFGLLPDVTADQHTMLGQNWDWLASIRGRCLVLRIHRSSKPSLVCLTEAGIVGGKMGLNEAGIGLVQNGLASDRDGCNPYEKPFHVRCREVLDGESLHDAMLPVIQTRRSCSANFIVGCASGEIVDLETSPNTVTSINPVNGILSHANHFIDTRHGTSQIERIGPSTLFRAARLERNLRRNSGQIGLAEIRQAFSDHSSYPNSICRHPDQRQCDARRTMTLASVVLDLDTREMWLSEGTPCDGTYTSVSLSNVLASAVRASSPL